MKALLAILCISITAFSVRAYARDSTIYKHTVSFNPTLLYLRQACLTYEYRLSPKIGVETTLGFIYNGERTWIIGWPDPDGTDNMPQRGQLVRLNFKYYFHHPFYFSSMYQFKHIAYTGGDFGTYSQDDPYGIMNENRYVNGISALIGSTYSFRHLKFDAFFGAGCKYSIRHIQYTYYNGSREPGIDPLAPKTLRTVAPLIHLGFKIGYQFGNID